MVDVQSKLIGERRNEFSAIRKMFHLINFSRGNGTAKSSSLFLLAVGVLLSLFVKSLTFEFAGVCFCVVE